jgi:hypothetical protein
MECVGKIFMRLIWGIAIELFLQRFLQIPIPVYAI